MYFGIPMYPKGECAKWTKLGSPPFWALMYAGTPAWAPKAPKRKMRLGVLCLMLNSVWHVWPLCRAKGLIDASSPFSDLPNYRLVRRVAFVTV